MVESATVNRREQRMLRTAEQLTSISRRLTAEHGLNGFTVEELCDQVGISRRTFFNYFSSKEDAVIGANPEDGSRQFAASFLARGSRGWDAVVDDLADLVIENVATAGIDATSHGEFMTAIEREPRLLTRFIGMSRERERDAVALVAQREGVDPDDERAVATVQILVTLMRTTGDRFLDPANTRQFEDLLSSSLGALRAVLSTTTPRKAHQ